MIFNLLHSIMRQLLDVVRWNDDEAIAHDDLRMFITNST